MFEQANNTQPQDNGQISQQPEVLPTGGAGLPGVPGTNSAAVPGVQVQQPQTAPVNPYGFDPNDEQFQAFNSQLQNYLGVDAYALRNYASYVAEQQRESALTPLRQEWGDGFEQNFGLVRERFSQLPPHQQAIYDNVDGARFLYQQILSEQGQQQQQVPTFDRGKVSAGTGSQTNGRYQYKQSEILAMSKADYSKNARAIAAAYSQGLVDLNG